MQETANTQRLWTGRDLAAERIRQGLRQADLAESLGVSGSRVAGIEATWRPAPAVVRRYLAALGLTPERRVERASIELADALECIAR
jgi:transcriptional regulator with XRE-family HTH domain